MLFHVFLVITLITILTAANVTFELSDSHMLRHVTTQDWRCGEAFAASLAPVRVAPMGSQCVQTRVAPMTLWTVVFIKAWATRHCALQKHKYRICWHWETRAQQLYMYFTCSKTKVGPITSYPQSSLIFFISIGRTLLMYHDRGCGFRSGITLRELLKTFLTAVLNESLDWISFVALGKLLCDWIVQEIYN